MREGVRLEAAEIKNYEAKEQREIQRVLKRFRGEQRYSILDFFPEFSDLRKQFHTADIPPRYRTYYPELPLVDVNFLVATHDSVVVGLEPIPESTFQQWYGLSVSDLRELTRKKIVKVRLSAPPTSYANLDYLHELIRNHPPTYMRATAFCEYAAGGKAELARITKSCESVFGQIGLDTNLAFPAGLDGIDVIGSLKADFLRLTLLGFSSLLGQIKESSRSPEDYYKALRREYLAKAAGVFRSLQGSVAVPLGEMSSNLNRPSGLPFESVRFLFQRIELNAPKNLDEALSFRSRYKSLRSACREIENSISQGELDVPTKDALYSKLESALTEVDEMIDRSEDRRRIIGWVFLGASLLTSVPTFGVSAALGVSQALASGAFAISQHSLKLDDRVARRITGRKRPHYIRGLFELYSDESISKKLRKDHLTKRRLQK